MSVFLNLSDRLTRGFIAGFLGGIVMSIFDHILFALGITEVLFLDWAAVFIYGYRPATIMEAVVAQIGQLFFSGMMGIFFAYLIPIVTSVNYLFKGWLYGFSIFFGSYAIAVLYDVTSLIPIKTDTVLSNIVTASIYGLVLAQVLYWMDKKVEIFPEIKSEDDDRSLEPAETVQPQEEPSDSRGIITFIEGQKVEKFKKPKKPTKLNRLKK